MYKPGCEYCVTVPDSQSEERLKHSAKFSIIFGLISILLFIAALFDSLQNQQLTPNSSQFVLPTSFICMVIAVILMICSSKQELYLFQDAKGVEHLHVTLPIRVGQIWHCNNPNGTAIQIKKYIVVIRPNGWSNTRSYVLNPVDYSWKEIRAYSAYHSDSVELRDRCNRGPRVSVGEALTIINSCDDWSEYQEHTFRLGVAMCLARRQAQFGRQTQPSPNAAAMRRTLEESLAQFRDQKQVAEWEEVAGLEFKRLYPGSSLTAEQLSSEPTQPSETVA